MITVFVVPDSGSINQFKSSIRIVDFVILSINRNFRSEGEEGEGEAEAEVSAEGRVDSAIDSCGVGLDSGGGV